MSVSGKKRKATSPAAPAVVVKAEISEAAAWDARELQARRGEPLTRDVVDEELDTLWNTWMNTPANSRMRRVRLQHEFPGGMAAWERARALQAAIDKTADTNEWEALRLELCTLLWLAQHAYPRLHLDERPHADAIDLTAAHVLPPATLYPQERKLLTDQLQTLLGTVQNPLPTQQQLCLLVAEYLRFMDLKRAAPPESLSPSAAIDDVWLSHVVCTSAYAAFCERHFGAFPPEADDASAASGMTARVPSATGGGDGGGGGDAEGASMSSAPVVAAAAAAAGAHQPRAAHSEAAAEPSAADKPSP
ncbi:hypothetical protein JKP88DRAFT_283713 [Tribonema minus]|uniref:Uncharacterized protein n=1 Tax=Tribonema minus TaxID=303371 RepID=A0A835YQ99_9STRA|nr:hypothetical protein JKP88DRAFT_283713 [Tribonema minus]